MIEKPTIIIASLGRTGTKFFYALFKDVIPGSTSLHEPDGFHIGRGNGVRRIIEQTREAGAYNMFIRKALGQWSLASLSHARVRGELGYAEAVRQVLSQRGQFVRSRSGSVYVESSLGCYGLIDVFKDVFARHRVAYIVRDGRDWVRSKMNRAQMYNRGRIRDLFAHRWPVASDFEDDCCRSEWATMSRFARLCWAWAKLNGYVLETIQKNPDARLFRFEDIFASEERYQRLADLVQFATAFPDVGRVATGSPEGWLDRRLNVSVGPFPSWEGWSPEQKEWFEVVCGPLMSRLGYE
jgi:hypothetical protein